MRTCTRSLAWSVAGACVAMAGLAGAGVTAIRATAPERILAQEYGQALADIDTSWGSRHAGNLWLSTAPMRAPRPALAVGDRITIAARNGGEQAIEVTALEEVDGEALGLAGTRFQIVTARPARGSLETVRFLFAVDTPPAAPAGRDRTL